MRQYVYATTALLRLQLRQNRIFLLVWLLLPGVWAALNTASALVLFPTQAALEQMGSSLVDPLTEAMHGPLLELSVAGFVTWRTKIFLILLCGIFSIVHVIRHTRLAEEQGKRELLGANATGSLAMLLAALGGMVLVNGAAAGLTVAAMAALGLGLGGALIHGLGFFCSACVLGVAAAVAAQLFTSATAARGVSLGLLGAAFGLHILWNAGGRKSALAYLNPMEWPLLVRPYAGERYLVLLIPLALGAALAALSLGLMARRDMGGGLVPQRRGRAAAPPARCTLRALTWRTQGGLLISWICFYALFSFALGCASYLLVNAVSGAEALADFIARLGGVDQAFLSLFLYVFGLLTAVYVILSVSVLRREELAKGELLLALPVPRARLMLGHMVYIFGGTAAIMLVSGLCVGLGAVIGTGDRWALLRLLLKMAGMIPALWVVGGIALLLYGALPKWTTGLCYGLLTLFLLMEILWEQQQIPLPVYGLSPFSWITPLKAAQPAAAPLVLCAVAAALTGVGLVLFRRRDLAC